MLYEKFKNDFITQLAADPRLQQLEPIERKGILECLDKASYNYSILEKTTTMIPIDGLCANELKTYIACKAIEGQSTDGIKNRAYVLKLALIFINKPLKDIEANDIRLFLYYYQDNKKIKSTTLDKYRQYLSSFFKWAVEEEYISKDPTLKIKKIKTEIKPREALSQEQLEYLRLAAKDTRESAIIELLYSTGCRVEELCTLKKTDVNFETKEVHLFGKGKKHRTSYLNAKAIVALKRYWETMENPTEYVICSLLKPYHPITPAAIEKMFREFSQRTGFHITPHIMRHTTATTALHNGMPIEEIQRLLGHEKIETTMIYAKADQDSVKMSHQHYIV